MLVLLFVALWFILRGDLLYVFPCVILFLCFSVLLVLRLPRLGKRELILVVFVRSFDLCLFGFVSFLFLGVREELRFVIVALPGLFSYLFLTNEEEMISNIKFLPVLGKSDHLVIDFSLICCTIQENKCSTETTGMMS